MITEATQLVPTPSTIHPSVVRELDCGKHEFLSRGLKD